MINKAELCRDLGITLNRGMYFWRNNIITSDNYEEAFEQGKNYLSHKKRNQTNLARETSVRPDHIYNWIKAGLLLPPTVRLGKVVFFTHDDFNENITRIKRGLKLQSKKSNNK